jgi:hypothetical protein
MLISKHDAQDAAEGVGIAFIVTVVAIVFILVIGGGLWAFGVFASGTKGAGDVHRKNQDANNRISAQATFEKLAGDIQAYPAKIANAAADRTAHSDDTYYATVLTGLESACADAVATYNADAQTTTMRDWRPANLPESYDNTICEATK